MDQNMDSSNPAGENQPPQTPPPEYNASAPPIPEQPPVSEPPTAEAPGELSKDAKMWAMFCHLAALALFTSIPFAWVIGPLVIWLIKKDDFPFVEEQGKESLNFQISVSIYMLCCLPLVCLGGIGAFLIAGIAIADLVFIIIGSINASNGQSYRYPCCIRMIK
jgi:uncharacterized Tic20 family protein